MMKYHNHRGNHERQHESRAHLLALLINGIKVIPAWPAEQVALAWDELGASGG